MSALAARLRALGGARVDPGVGILAVGVAVLWGPLFPELVRDWIRSEDFSHGFFVIPIAMWWLHARRTEILAAPSRPFLPAAFLLAGACAQLLVGVAASEHYLQRTSLVPFLVGGIALFWGPARARATLFAVVYLVFMVPPPVALWNSVALPLQLLASGLAETVLEWFRIPIERSGNVIHLPNCSLEVAAACSGLRSLVTLLALGAILAEGTLAGSSRPRGRGMRVLVFAAVVPVAVAVNTARVSGTALAVAAWGPEAASGVVHDAAGIGMFVVSLGILLAWRKLLGWIESTRFASSPSS